MDQESLRLRHAYLSLLQHHLLNQHLIMTTGNHHHHHHHHLLPPSSSHPPATSSPPVDEDDDDPYQDYPLDLSLSPDSKVKRRREEASKDPRPHHQDINLSATSRLFISPHASRQVGLGGWVNSLSSPSEFSFHSSSSGSFDSPQQVNLHVTNHHPVNKMREDSRPLMPTATSAIVKKRERTMLPCSYCGKSFDRPSLLKRHIRTHTGEKPHVCDVCGKGFSTSSSLNTHRRIHSGEKPHQCPVCGKRFTASSNLYYHRMTHNKEKPHKCLLCPKSFPTPGDLKSHMYVHNGSWPFKCPVCSRGFSKQTNLKHHMMNHQAKNIPSASAEVDHLQDDHAGTGNDDDEDDLEVESPKKEETFDESDETE